MQGQFFIHIKTKKINTYVNVDLLELEDRAKTKLAQRRNSNLSIFRLS